MRKITLFFLFGVFLFAFNNNLSAQQIGINSKNPDQSAYLDISGNEKGLLPPRLSATDRSKLDKLGATYGPSTGLVIFNTTDSVLQVNKGTKQNPDWTSLTSSASLDPKPTVKDKWIYLPVTPLSMSLAVGEVSKTINLYNIYKEQLEKPLNLTYTRDQLEFVVLNYDPTCFVRNMVFMVDDEEDEGYENTLYYRPIPGNVTDQSYINIAIKIAQ